MPGFAGKISLYTGKNPVFDQYGIEIDIERALGRKVWLKSGGYIIIDQTEALTAIDVNTGKYVGKRNQEETILKTNLAFSYSSWLSIIISLTSWVNMSLTLRSIMFNSW